jgi:hypothetical protein
MGRLSTTLWVAACALIAGCASTPRMPSELDLSRASLVAGAAEPSLALDGPSGKGAGAVTGAAKGGGVGFLVGGVACMGTGPFAPLCLSLMVPASTAIGAVSGAVVGAVRAESADDVAAKRSLLQAELAAPVNHARLATHFQKMSRDMLVVDWPLTPAGAGAAAPDWTVQIAMTELATVGAGADTPYALHASASLEVTRAGAAQPAFVKHYHALTADKLTTSAWQADDAKRIRAALDDMSAQLASKMVNDLKHARR